MRRWLAILALCLVAVVVAGTGVGLALEENDSFCASCHTQPETLYVRQAQAALGPRSATLAALHHRLETVATAARPVAPVKCIDCHGGVGAVARVHTLVELGVMDTLAFISGRYEQPARTTRPLPDINCAQCHAEAVAAPGFDNHFHTKLADPQAPTINCVSCHLSHFDQVDPREKYIRRAAVFDRCNECHRQMGGPTNLR